MAKSARTPPPAAPVPEERPARRGRPEWIAPSGAVDLSRGEVADPVARERNLYRLRVVDLVRNDRAIQAPFHYHTAGHATFCRSTNRPSPTGELDDAGKIVRERVQGALCWLTNEQVDYIRDVISRRYVEWQKGSADISGKTPPDPYFKGAVRIVRKDQNPNPGWMPVALFLRMDLIEDPASVGCALPVA